MNRTLQYWRPIQPDGVALPGRVRIFDDAPGPIARCPGPMCLETKLCRRFRFATPQRGFLEAFAKTVVINNFRTQSQKGLPVPSVPHGFPPI